METALMSGTPVPIYVRKKRSDSVSTKFFRSSSTKKTTKKKKISDGNRSSASSGLAASISIGSRDSTEVVIAPQPAGMPLQQFEPPASTNLKAEMVLSPTAASSTTILLPPPPEIPLPPPPRQPAPPRKLRRKSSNPALARRPQSPPIYHHHGLSDPEDRPFTTGLARTLSAKTTLPERSISPYEPYYVEPLFSPVVVDAVEKPTRPERPPRPPRPRSVSVSGPINVSMDYVHGVGPSSSSNQLNPTATYQHIQDMSAKRVSTLDYLRKTHEGRVYWFNTLLFSRSDLGRLPSFDPKRLARRAANLLVLGLSLPTVLDLNTPNPLDFLKALNALLLEFETYQQVHPADGSSASSLSRARLPQMFKRSTNIKGRRTSSAADIGLPFGGSDPSDLKSMVGSIPSAALNTAAFGSGEDLLPGEQYSYLVTPSIPFDPDFFEVFASICDVLIDCYMRITNLVSSPEKCVPGIAEVFAKADARLRKVIVAGIVKEFEDATRAGVKNEINGIGRVVLGGLM